MGTKIRKQIYIDLEHEVILKQLSADMGISEAEIIRQAVEQYNSAVKPRRRNIKAWEEEKAFIQQLIEHSSAQDSALKKRTWNREELYDRKVLRGQ